MTRENFLKCFERTSNDNFEHIKVITKSGKEYIAHIDHIRSSAYVKDETLVEFWLYNPDMYVCMEIDDIETLMFIDNNE